MSDPHPVVCPPDGTVGRRGTEEPGIRCGPRRGASVDALMVPGETKRSRRTGFCTRRRRQPFAPVVYTGRLHRSSGGAPRFPVGPSGPCVGALRAPVHRHPAVGPIRVRAGREPPHLREACAPHVRDDEFATMSSRRRCTVDGARLVVPAAFRGLLPVPDPPRSASSGRAPEISTDWTPYPCKATDLRLD